MLNISRWSLKSFGTFSNVSGAPSTLQNRSYMYTLRDSRNFRSFSARKPGIPLGKRIYPPLYNRSCIAHKLFTNFCKGKDSFKIGIYTGTREYRERIHLSIKELARGLCGDIHLFCFSCPANPVICPRQQ